MSGLTTGLVSSSDIAEAAGVSRGAVSNWRKRHDEFPKPVAGSATKPLFSRAEVTSWLLANGHQPVKDNGQSAVWAIMNELRGQLPVSEITDLLLELLVARKTGTPSRSWDRVLPRHREHVQAVLDRVAPEDLAAVGDYALERLERSQGRSGGTMGFVGSRTTAILASLAAARPGGVLYDPACGIAAALLEAVARGAAPRRVVGHDMNAEALRIAAQRAVLHGVDLELVQTDVLASDIDPALAADTIILEPPFGMAWEDPSPHFDPRFQFGIPRRSSSDLLWIQHVVAHLTENGRGYVLTSVGTLSTGAAEARIRAGLLHQGCVEAIIGLPGKLLPQTSIPLALWVLRRPHSSPAGVLLIDGSTSESLETDAAAWVNEPTAREAVPHTSVPVAELIADDSVLIPARWTGLIAPEPTDITTVYSRERAGLDTAVELVGRIGSDLPRQVHVGAPRVVTIGELMEQGVLELAVGRQRDEPGGSSREATPGVVRISDVRDGTLVPVGSTDVGERPEVTTPGDVLVTTTQRVGALVDEFGGHVPGLGVHRLRVLAPDVVVPGYLAFALTGSWNDRLQEGAALQRAPIRLLEVPLTSKTDQLKTLEALDACRQLAHAAHELASHADAVRDAVLDATRFSVQLPAIKATKPR